MTPAPLTAIAAIEKAVEGVTPGTWGAHQTVIHGRAYGGHWVEVADEDQLIQISGSGGARSYTQRVFDTQGHDDNEANARYVAACNPVAMREVLAAARKAEALQRENAELREALRPFADVADLADSETEGVSDDDEFQMHFHDYLLASWKLSIFRRALAATRSASATTSVPAVEPVAWRPADEAPRGIYALIKHRSGQLDLCYKTDNGEPFLETWRYAGTAKRGEQAPWPESYIPISELRTASLSTRKGSAGGGAATGTSGDQL